MLNSLKDLLFGSDYEAIIKEKDRIISNFEKIVDRNILEIQQLNLKLHDYQQERFSYHSLLREENNKLRKELEAIKQVDKTLLEGLNLKENYDLKQKIKELEMIIESTKDYYSSINN